MGLGVRPQAMLLCMVALLALSIVNLGLGTSHGDAAYAGVEVHDLPRRRGADGVARAMAAPKRPVQERPVPSTAGEQGMSGFLQSPRGVHMVTVADRRFRKRYELSFQKMGEYAAAHGYSWTIHGDVQHTRCVNHNDYFFYKHCLIAEWMELRVPPDDHVFVFDADVVPYRS